MRAEKDLKNAAFENSKIVSDKEEIKGWKRITLFASLFVVVFLLGLIPMWLSGIETSRQRDAAQANLRISKMQNRLATAEINVRRGEYENARIAASDFFTDLRTEIDRNESVFDTEQRESIKPILGQRDDLITLLARNDPATGDRLADLYLNYLKVINPAPKKSSENNFKNIESQK